MQHAQRKGGFLWFEHMTLLRSELISLALRKCGLLCIERMALLHSGLISLAGVAGLHRIDNRSISVRTPFPFVLWVELVADTMVLSCCAS